MSHHHPQILFFFLCKDTIRISILTSTVPWLLLRAMSIRYLEFIWMLHISNTWYIYCWYAVFSSFPSALLPSNSEKEARLISRGFSWQIEKCIEKCNTDCSRMKKKWFSQFSSELKGTVNISISQPAQVQWFVLGICRAEGYLFESLNHICN